MSTFTRLITLLSLLLVITACVAPAAPSAPAEATVSPAESPTVASEAATPEEAAAEETTVEEATTEEATADCRLITHDMGETEVCGTPKVVVALGPYMLDILLALGVQAAGYAETQQLNEKDWGKPVDDILYLGAYVETMPINVGDRQAPNMEVLTALKPDLILSEMREEDQMELFQQIAPTLAYSGNLADDWQRAIVPIAEALNIPAEAERVIAEHEAFLAEKRVELEPITAQYPRISFISQDQKGLLRTFTTNSWPGDLLTDLGYEVVFDPSDGAATDFRQDLSVEQMPTLETDTIIVGATDATLELAEEQWMGNAVLMANPASVAGRVFFVDYQLWGRLRGPIAARLVTEELMRFLTEKPTR